MDCAHHPPVSIPEPSSAPAPPAAACAPQEATGDSESDAPAASSAPTVLGDRPSVAGYGEDDDAESCSGSAIVYATFCAAADDCDEDDTMTMGGDDEGEVDSWKAAAVPWWRGTAVQDAADGAAGGCARTQAEVAAESNRLFWESCIAHGY